VIFDQVWDNSDAVFWFAPEAICYYLPGLPPASLREDRLDANACDALIGMLDRSPEPACWGDFFAPRWTLLSLPTKAGFLFARMLVLSLGGGARRLGR
jgi:hypothetical protein